MVWCSTAWYGAVQHGMVQNSMVWCSTAWYGSVQHGMVQYSMVWFSTAWYGAVQCGMVQYSMVWCSTVWYGVVQHGMVQYSMVCHTMVQYSVVWCSTAWYGAVQCGMVQYSMVWCSTVWYGAVQCGRSGVAVSEGTSGGQSLPSPSREGTPGLTHWIPESLRLPDTPRGDSVTQWQAGDWDSTRETECDNWSLIITQWWEWWLRLMSGTNCWKAAGVVWKNFALGRAEGLSKGKPEGEAWGFAFGKSRGIQALLRKKFSDNPKLFNSLSDFGFLEV